MSHVMLYVACVGGGSLVTGLLIWWVVLLPDAREARHIDRLNRQVARGAIRRYDE